MTSRATSYESCAPGTHSYDVRRLEGPSERLRRFEVGQQATFTHLGERGGGVVLGGEQGGDGAAVAGHAGPGDAERGVERVDGVLAVGGVRRRAEVVHDRVVLECHERVTHA